MSRLKAVAAALLGTLSLGGYALAADWSNAGANAQRNCETTEAGPDSGADLLWSGGRSSIISWQPVIEGDRVFMVRQTGFPPGGEPNGSPVIAMNLYTGGELWRADVPYNSGDWTTWVAGARDGKVYASRSGNGASVAARMYALDAATGAVVWVSTGNTRAGAYDGVVFADNGDLIVADFYEITRIRATDGGTVYKVPRTASVSGTCGAALFGNAIYVVDAVVGGNAVRRHDLATGAFQYQSPVMTGFTIQNTPFVGPDGTVYVSRTQNNAATDFFYAFSDEGSLLTQKWSTAARWTTNSEFAATQGSVYMLAPGNIIQHRDAASGALLGASAALTFESSAAPRMALDKRGWLYVSNGGFSQGRMYALDEALNTVFSVGVTNINIGGPVIGNTGTLVVSGVGTDIRAYRTNRPCLGDLNADTVVDLLDLSILLSNFGSTNATPEEGDLNGDQTIDLTDLSMLLVVFGTPCP